MTLGLSPAEDAFVDHLIDLGDPSAAAVAAGVQPALAHDPRVQAALVERIREHGALDAVFARKIMRDLAEKADQDSVRLRAATTLWERGLGKIPEQVNVDVSIKHIPRESLFEEIKGLIEELGLPQLIEGEFEEIAEIGSSPTPPAGVAQSAEQPEEPPPRDDAGSSPATGTKRAPDHDYAPTLPTKWQ